MIWQNIRSTSPDRIGAAIRILLAVLFLMTGGMKLLVPMLADAWAGQLSAANIPMAELNRIVVPFVEIGVGAALLVGSYTRVAVLLVMSIMVVATYVHLVVDDPTVFPLQPSEPIIPAVVMILALYLLARGAGSASLDLRVSDQPD